MQVVQQAKSFLNRLKGHDFGFYAAAFYLFLEYVRPQSIYPLIDFLPWAQITIVAGFLFVLAKGQIKVHGTHTLMFAFMASVVISCIFSYDPASSWKRIDYIISWFIVVLFFVGSVRSVEQYKLLTILLFLFLFKLSLFGAKSWVMRGFSFTGWGVSGPRGFFENSGELSLLMVIFASMSFAFIAGHKKKSRLYYIVPLTAVMTVLAASSRGSQLALAVVIVLLAISIGKLKAKNIVGFALIAWLGFILLPEEQKERFSTMGEDETSESRLIYWEKGLDMMNNHKLIGIGYYAFPSYFEDQYAPYIEFDKFRYRRELAHNSYIQVGSEMGYTGLFLYLMLIYHCIRLNRKTRFIVKDSQFDHKLNWVETYCKGLNISIIGYMVGSTFMSVAFYPYLYLFLMLSQSLHNTVRHEVLSVGSSQRDILKSPQYKVRLGE